MSTSYIRTRDRFILKFNPYDPLPSPKTPYQRAIHDAATSSERKPINPIPTLTSIKPPSIEPPSVWQIPKKPEKRLDSSEMTDNFHLSPIDWQHEQIVYAPKTSVTLHNPQSATLTTIQKTWSQILSIRWDPTSPQLLSSHQNGDINIFTPDLPKPAYSHSFLNKHYVIPIQWRKENECSAGIGSDFMHIDIRAPQPIRPFPLLEGRIQAIDWHPHSQLAAISTSTGQVKIYDLAKADRVFFEYTHKADYTVKALQWSPSGQYLATGGGSFDQMLHIVDPHLGTTRSLKVHAQVCSMIWLDRLHLITGLGYSGPPENIRMYRLHDDHLLPIKHPSLQPGRILSVIKNPQAPQYATLSGGGKATSNDEKSELHLWRATRIPEKEPHWRNTLTIR